MDGDLNRYARWWSIVAEVMSRSVVPEQVCFRRVVWDFMCDERAFEASVEKVVVNLVKVSGGESQMVDT